MQRREFLKFSIGAAAVVGLSAPAAAQSAPKEIRIGYQKTGVLVIARQQASLERHFATRKWL